MGIDQQIAGKEALGVFVGIARTSGLKDAFDAYKLASNGDAGADPILASYCKVNPSESPSFVFDETDLALAARIDGLCSREALLSSEEKSERIQAFESLSTRVGLNVAVHWFLTLTFNYEKMSMPADDASDAYSR